MTFGSETPARGAGRRYSDRSDLGTARVRDKAFDAVRGLWNKRKSEGVKLKDVAERIGADPGWVSKHLRGPGNWTMRTFGALVEGLDGEAEIQVFPMEEQSLDRSNFDAYAQFGPPNTPNVTQAQVVQVPILTSVPGSSLVATYSIKW
jgi:hypothetical protein